MVSFLADQIAGWPLAVIGGVRFLEWGCWPRVFHAGLARLASHGPGPRSDGLAEDIGPGDFVRFEDLIELDLAIGGDFLAVEIRGFDFDFDRFRFGLPIVCRQVGLGCDEPDRDALGSGACFAIRVGDICGDIVSEDRRIDFGDRTIWFGDKFDLEASVGIGFGPALGDLLRTSLVGSDAPSEAGEEPIGPSHGADDTVANFRILDGRTGVAHRFAVEGDFVIELDLVFDSIEGHLEFWPFVFFDVDCGGKRAVFDRENHGSRAAISRSGHRATERAKVIAR